MFPGLTLLGQTANWEVSNRFPRFSRLSAGARVLFLIEGCLSLLNGVALISKEYFDSNCRVQANSGILAGPAGFEPAVPGSEAPCPIRV